MIQIGQHIPEIAFEVFHEEKIKKVSLADYKSRWLVLLFYPADFTFICPTELEEVAEYYNEFKKIDAEVISISTDTVFAHKAWHDNSPAIKKVRYPMAADPTGTLSKAFGTYLEADGLSLRATVIIDPDGVVKAYDIHDLSIGRSTEEILRKLRASKFVREHKGQVCPASWKPGKKTLRPGIKLVGKI